MLVKLLCKRCNHFPTTQLSLAISRPEQRPSPLPSPGVPGEGGTLLGKPHLIAGTRPAVPGPIKSAFFLTIALLVSSGAAAGANSADWPNVGNDKGGMRYSTLDQINRENVKRLQVAWTYHTGDSLAAGETIECTPIVVDGVMYVTTGRSRWSPSTRRPARRLWKFDPLRTGLSAAGGREVDQGLRRREPRGAPTGRTASRRCGGQRPRLPRHGGRAADLAGREDRQARPGVRRRAACSTCAPGLERDISQMAYGPTSAPAVFEGPGHRRLLERRGPAPPRRATSGRSTSAPARRSGGSTPSPRPGEFGTTPGSGTPWEDRGGANAWGGFTLDAERGVVFMGTGSAVSDFYGGDRQGGQPLRQLHARAGRPHGQAALALPDGPPRPVGPRQPLPAGPRRRSSTTARTIDAVAQLTKTGYCFLFDRRTGKPLFDVEETPAPASDVPGEQASPTQPVPRRSRRRCRSRRSPRTTSPTSRPRRTTSS